MSVTYLSLKNGDYHSRGVNPPMFFPNSVLKRVRVLRCLSQARWNSFVLNSCLEAVKRWCNFLGLLRHFWMHLCPSALYLEIIFEQEGTVRKCSKAYSYVNDSLRSSSIFLEDQRFLPYNDCYFLSFIWFILRIIWLTSSKLISLIEIYQLFLLHLPWAWTQKKPFQWFNQSLRLKHLSPSINVIVF